VARKQVLVQLDDELVNELDRIAGRAGASRSDLIRRSARALIEAFTEAEAERTYLEAYRVVPQDGDDLAPFLREVARRLPPWQ
jgi:metal-responsive CopG/Arc/MetJ family transcriptional regulator